MAAFRRWQRRFAAGWRQGLARNRAIADRVEQMVVDSELCFGLTLAGERRGQPFDWRGAAPAEVHWIQVDLTHETEAWLLNRGRVDPTVLQALVAEGARPRAASFEEGCMVVLRGINLNPGAEPEDMVSVRMWIEPGRILTVTPRRVRAVLELREMLAAGRGPRGIGELLVAIATRMVERVQPIFAELDEDTDQLQECLLDDDLVGFRQRLSLLRRRLIQFRRHLAPQSSALLKLMREQTGLFPEQLGEQLRELCEKSSRYVEDVQSMTERAKVMQDELEGRLNERMTRNMQFMSLATVMFLPLSFFASMLGMNVGGIPWATDDNGFWYVGGFLALIVLSQGLVLKRTRFLQRI